MTKQKPKHPRVTLPLALLRPQSKKQADDLVVFLKEHVPYQSGDESVYQSEELFNAFIGREADLNAKFGRRIAELLNHPKGSAYLETCSGPGTMCRDINQWDERATTVGVDISAAMCEMGRKLNPHMTFVEADVLDPGLGRKIVDETGIAKFKVAMNSAASIGFFTAEQLEYHIFSVFSALDRKTGSYFAETGYYASPVAASVNNVWGKKGSSFLGTPSIDWTVTTKYYPLTDFHEICWSAWSKDDDPAKLLFGLKHKLRAYRPSELAQIANRLRLGFRLWRFFEDEAGQYQFQLLDENFFYQYDNQCDLLCEFHQPDAPLLVQP
jgi:SAM-dependent methyltransferase